ncbi:hypothetical protein WJX84_007951 [Apatococcus fuscideae]|uniref:CTLH domain-containing protein n=1 Tax=Apatococcus fuscideae TaxID=2026836 RepID=A0AAW1TMW8_9CHLO
MQPNLQTGQAPAINQEWLDTLVISYLQHQGAFQAERPYTARLLTKCEEVRDLVESGLIKESLITGDALHPTLSQNLRLVFQLKKQQLIELLRLETCHEGAAAVAFIRRELAPLALKAYDTSYEEFRRCLLLLAYPEDATYGPVQKDWDLAARSKLAAMFCRTLRQASGAEPCRLALLVRYLSRSLKLYKALQGPAAAGDDPEAFKAASRLECHAQDCPPLPCEASRGFPEPDVQCLREAAGISRQEAVESLRHTQGNIHLAISNELSSWHIDTPYLDQLVEEYANFKGLLQPPDGAAKPHGSCAATNNGSDLKACQSGPVDMDLNEHAAATSSASQDVGAGTAPPGSQSATSTKGQAECRNHPVQHRSSSQSPPHKALRSNDGASPHSTAHPTLLCQSQPFTIGLNRNQRLSALLLKVRACSEAGSADEVEAALVRELGPAFLESHQEIAFHLHRCRFGQLVRDGHTEQALCLLRHSMAPIALSLQHLQPCLKASTACLLPHSALQHQFAHITPAPKALQQSLENVLDLPEPMLVRVLRLLLHCHAEWLKVQRCKDRFEAHLGISQLREAAPDATPRKPHRPHRHPGATDAGGDEVLEAAAVAAPGGDIDYEDTQSMDEDEEPAGPDGVPEGPVLLLMEWSGLPRGMAIDLLAAHGNDPNAVLAEIYN